MNEDFISKMSFREMSDACEKILGSGPWAHHSLVGLIIEKLQDWKVRIEWGPEGWLIGGSCYNSDSLKKSFLKEALIRGHWTPPKKVKEEPQTLEERVDALEAKMRVLLPSYGTGNLHAKPQ